MFLRWNEKKQQFLRFQKQRWTYNSRHNAGGGGGPRQRNVSLNSQVESLEFWKKLFLKIFLQSSAGGGDGLGFATSPGPSTMYFGKRF